MRSLEHSTANMYFMARGLQEKPNAPTVNTNNEGAVTVTPYSAQNENVDKVELSYTNKNNERKTVTLIRNAQNGTWTSSGDGADGIQINGNSFSVKAGYANAGTEVSAISYFGNSDASDRNKVTVPTDTQPPVVKIRTGQSTTTLPEARPADNAPAVYEVTQGQPFAPSLEAFDNTGKITKFEIGGGLPTGVSLSNNVSSTANYTETSPYRPTFTGDVPNTMEPGVYTRTITVNDGKTGDKTYHFKYKVLPAAPRVTTPQNQGGTLVSTDRSISGTGQPGAKVKITLQDGTTVREVTVENNGKWKYNLAPNEKLTQNDKDSTIKASNPISVKQVVNNIESVAKTVNVQMARAISVETPVQAGREIKVKVAHDTALFYLQVNYGTAKEYQYDVIQENGK